MDNKIKGTINYRICEYLLVLQPHEELLNTIMYEKKLFAEKYNCPAALHLNPHIVLVRFKQYKMMEMHIIHQLKNITMGLASFKTELKGFSSFPSHTVYINVSSKIQIIDTSKALRAAQKLMKIDEENKPHFIIEPHIAIARKLLPWQYEKAWLEYEHKHFHGRFIADHLLLLRKMEGNKLYQVVEKYMFQNIKTEIKQGALF